MKKIISLALITLTLLGCSVQAMAKEDKFEYHEFIRKYSEYYYNVKRNNIYYNIEIRKNKKGKITKKNAESVYATRKGNVLKYPDKIKFKGKKFKVNEIEYRNQTKIPYKKIYIPKYATAVDYWFNDLSYVENIYISKSVRALSGIQNWQNVNLIISNDNKYLKMQNGAVYSKDGKTLRYLINAQKQYQISAGTENVEIKDNKVVNDLIINSEIKKLYLSNVKNLSSVTFSEGVKNISQNTFNSCKCLGKIIIEDKDKAPNIELQAFINSKNQIDFYVKNQKVADDLLKQLKNKDIGVDKSNIYVENTLVYQNVSYDTRFETSKSQVRMGKNIIGTYSDDGKTLTVSGDGKMDNGDDYITLKTKFEINENVEKVILEEGITSIAYCAFKNLKIKEIKIPDSVKMIDEYAFISCENLENIDFGNGVETIGSGAFSYCTALKHIKLPKSLKRLASNRDPDSTDSYNPDTFLKCSSLESVDIGESEFTNNIAHAFRYCDKLKTFTVSKNNKKFTVKNNVVFNKNMTVLHCYPNGKPQKSYTVPSTVRRIDRDAFGYAINLKKVKLNNKLVKISRDAFSNSKITSITIPKSVKTIRKGAFNSCYKLKKVILQNTKQAPKFDKKRFSSVFPYASKINFYVKNKKVAKSLKKNLKGLGVENAKIYIGKKLIYKLKY